MTELPDAAYIEVIERTDDEDPSVIVPNEVRINGIPLLMPAGQSITVHDIGLTNDDAVQVTLTLFARRIRVDSEPRRSTRSHTSKPPTVDQTQVRDALTNRGH